MNSKAPIILRATIGLVVFVIACSLAAWWAGQLPEDKDVGPWYSVVPPFAAIILAFATRRVVLSLAFAIFLGGLLVHLPGNLASISAWGHGLWASPTFVYDAVKTPLNLQILIFVPLMFAMVLVIAEAGGFHGMFVHISKVIKGRKSAQFATASAGVIYFFDDYSNTMVIGSAMRSLTDFYRVSREKLAFIIDSTSAPIACLALISTWIMYEVGLYREAAIGMGIENTGYSIFLDALRYQFYCIFVISLVFIHILLGRDFGPMKDAELRAFKEGSGDSNGETSAIKASSFWVALIPLGGLLLFHFTGMWLDGGGPEKLQEGASLLEWSYWRDVVGNAENVVLIFACAAFFSLLLAVLCARFLASFPFSETLKCIWQGVKLSIVPCLILTCAWSLKNSSDALHTDTFLAALLADNVSVNLLPALVFVVACLTAFMTGTSWGTMAILIPMVGPVAFQMDGETYGLITIMSLAAVLDGSIFGDHCSPISDTTILSASASHCDLMAHVRTQLPYSILAAIAALVCGYLPVAFGLRWSGGFALGIGAIIAFFLIVGTRIEAQPKEST